MTESTNTPTVVLVHGGFADASFWAPVIEDLQAHDVPVLAPPNPLRGLAHDAEYVASYVNQIDGPVLLVGHSYGGAVMTNAATTAPNAAGLVYVSGFAPDEGERLIDIAGTSEDSILDAALVETKYPTGNGETAVEFSIDPALFHETFAADLPADQAAVMAATQRPVAAAGFTEVNGPPAWKSLPSWAVVGTGDKAAGADIVRSMAQRAGARTTELDGSHVIMVSRPRAVTHVILEALEAVS
jgi:pimeloyl-ACP methyl ester carboxylesterase